VPFLRWAIPILVVVDAVVTVGVRPRLRYRVHRWEVTDEAVYTLTGWLSRTWTLVPISRIQTVDVTRGVMQQLFGLASVAVLTASSEGTVRVPHLEADVAQRVADDLARRAAQVRDQAT
jgi:membrane protein YdbS with pleckstrin-like domain